MRKAPRHWILSTASTILSSINSYEEPWVLLCYLLIAMLHIFSLLLIMTTLLKLLQWRWYLQCSDVSYFTVAALFDCWLAAFPFSFFFLSVTGVPTPTTSTQVFYISVSVCCIVIFLVAIILAILHLHSMKRVEMEDRLAYFTCPGFMSSTK